MQFSVGVIGIFGKNRFILCDFALLIIFFFLTSLKIILKFEHQLYQFS